MHAPSVNSKRSGRRTIAAMPPESRTPIVLGALLVVAALARMALVVAHEPMLGYGDQADMQRITGCLGIRPDVPGGERLVPMPEAPAPFYVRGPVDEEPCSFGSELVIGAAAFYAHGLVAGESPFPMRWVGATKIALAALVLLAACALLWPFPRAFLLHGATALLVLGDPLTTLWMNTFYAEVPTFLGAYALIAALAGIALRGQAGALAITMLLAGVLLLGLSKIQFFLLPLALVAFALPVLVPAGRRIAAVALGVALVPCAVFLAPGKKGVLAPNRMDAYLGALAWSSSDPRATLARLGLPQRCEPLVGATAFRRRGEDVATLCPEVHRLGMAAFVPVLVHEPLTVIVSLARALAPGQNAFTGYLGFVAGMRYGRFENVAPWARSAWEPLFMRLRARHYVVLVVFAACVGILCALAYAILAFRRPRGAGFAIALYLSLLVLCYAYALATSVLGDGFADIGKHLGLGSAALAAALIAGMGWWLATWRSDSTRIMRLVTHGIVLLAGAATVPVVAAYRELPLAMGVIDEPGETRPPADAAVEVRGWALDPYGVRAVEARVGALRFAAQDDLPYPEVARVFPNFARAARSGFRVVVPAGTLTPQAPDLRIVVTNTLGRETEIDRRRMQ
jgi:hypothetical protein